MAKIFIGIPEYEPLKEFQDSLSQFLPIVKQHHDIEVYRVKGKTLVDAQNDIANAFLTSDKDYLLFLEEDHWGHTLEMLESLLKADTFVCGINYYSRHQCKISCLLMFTGRQEYHRRYQETGYIEGTHECDLVPFGMTLIKREVFEILDTPYFRLSDAAEIHKGVVHTDQAFCDDCMAKGIYPMGCFDHTLPHRQVTKDNYMELRKMDIMKGFAKAEDRVIDFYTKTILKNRKLKQTSPKILWIGSFRPDQSNVGDQAQTFAIEKYLKDKYPDYPVIQIYRDEELPNINPNDIVLINSSGDFGTMYPEWHMRRRDIINKYSNNKIIQLPVTVYYHDDELSKIILMEDEQIYSTSNITIMCREPESLNLISHFKCNTIYFPDFVFYLKPEITEQATNDSLLNIRDDGESNLSSTDKELLQETYGTDCYNYHKLNTAITPDIREKYLSDLFKLYQKHKLIVTDMMHGMIFAIINKVPYKVLNDKIPHKMVGYETPIDTDGYFTKDIINGDIINGLI